MSFANNKKAEPILDEELISRFEKLVSESEVYLKSTERPMISFEEIRDFYRFMVAGFCFLVLVSSFIILLSSVVLILKPKPVVFASSSDGSVFLLNNYDSAKSALSGFEKEDPRVF